MNIGRNEYIAQLPQTRETARDIRELNLQDKKLGGFEDVKGVELPIPETEIDKQLVLMAQLPRAYSGYQREDGKTVAFMKGHEWYTGDEAPFVENVFARRALQVAGKLRGHSMHPKAYGVFGLVAADTLAPGERDEILEDLLARSIGQAATESAALINIVIHDNDPLLPIALDYHFKQVGPLGRAAGAEGVLQPRYQRPVEV